MLNPEVAVTDKRVACALIAWGHASRRLGANGVWFARSVRSPARTIRRCSASSNKVP